LAIKEIVAMLLSKREPESITFRLRVPSPSMIAVVKQVKHAKRNLDVAVGGAAN